MAYPDGFLEELKARVPVSEVIGRRIALTRKGREFSGLCPFHQEKTPSFTVNDTKGFYHCFGCGAHGSVLDFVKNFEGLEFREAVERLAAEVGLDLPADSLEERSRAKRRTSLLDVTEAATRWFESQLRMPQGQDALAYLRQRGLNDESIGRYRLGFAPRHRSELKAALKRDGLDEALLIETGLLITPEDRERAAYDRFRGRVMFPISDRRGRVVAFGGRVLGGGEPKYLNSPETALFHKGRMLYGLHLAAPAARSTGTVIVSEGYMDVIGLSASGFPHTVAPLGTALTPEQLVELWRLAPEPVILFDPDGAGRTAAMRAAERALPSLAAGFGLRFAFIETQTGDDPDGVARRYGRQFVEVAIRNALSLSDMLFWMETQGRRLDAPEERAAAEARLRAHAARVPDATIRGHMQDTFRERLRPKFGRDRTRSTTPRQQSVPGVTRKPQSAEAGDIERRRETIMLAVVLAHPEAYESVGERLGMLAFRSPELDVLRQAVVDAADSLTSLDAEALRSHLCACGFSTLLDSVLSQRTFSDAFFARPGAELDTAIAGWEETFDLYRRHDLRSHLEDRKKALIEDLSDDGFERFASLKQQENERSK